MSKVNTGTLYVVSTPIGNLEDITNRAIKVLASVQYILCEDTRVTKKILNQYNISTKMISYNEKNEIKKISKVVSDLNNNFEIALVSDAGTPCISDPGFRLISHIKEECLDVDVLPIPGATAGIAALSISGLPSDSFFFVGFLPKKKGRNKKIKEFQLLKCSTILYESPYRLNRTFIDLYKILGNRKIFISREMTKLFEEYIYTDLKTLAEKDVQGNPKGEHVLIIAKEGYKSE
jgi:16S rRNA (cytidine1402-2'-O)-methyltransferase